MIAEECRKLRKQLEEVAKAEERENTVTQLEARCSELLGLRDSVLTVTRSLEAISGRIEIIGKLDSSKCVERVKKIRESLRTDPLSITKGKDLSNMTKAFEKFIETGNAAARETWEQYMPKARPTVDMNQVAQAEQQEAFKSKALLLRSRARHAEQIGKHPPANSEELSELEATWEDIRTMIAELPAVSDDPTVQEFLKAANSRTGASLDLLTEEVRQWLQQNNVKSKYRITTM
jgi:hypothetical protein